MSNSEREQIEKDVLYASESAKRAYGLQRIKLAQWGDALEALARGLKSDPESVNPLPEIDGPDYRAGLSLLDKRKEILEALSLLRTLEQAAKNAAQRKASLGF